MCVSTAHVRYTEVTGVINNAVSSQFTSNTICIRLIVMSYPIMPSLDQFSNVDRERERLLADLAALEMAGTSELCLNYRHLKDIPDELAGNSYCQISLIKLYLKGNLINEMVKFYLRNFHLKKKIQILNSSALSATAVKEFKGIIFTIKCTSTFTIR